MDRFMFFICLLTLIILFPYASGGGTSFEDDFSQRTLSDLISSGWTTTNEAGISFGENGIILNGTSGDTPIYRNMTGIVPEDWKVEVMARWLGTGHSGLNVFVHHENHYYGFSADGYYNNFALYRDGRKEKVFGTYSDSIGKWFTLSMVKEGNVISMFFQDELKDRFEEKDLPFGEVTTVAIISPWRGDAEYDWVRMVPLGEDGGSDGILGIPTPAILIGGGVVGSIVAGGAVLTYFLLNSGGGSAAAASGSSVGPTGTPSAITPSTLNTGGSVQPPSGGSEGCFNNTIPIEPSNPPEPVVQNDSGSVMEFFTSVWGSIFGGGGD